MVHVAPNLETRSVKFVVGSLFFYVADIPSGSSHIVAIFAIDFTSLHHGEGAASCLFLASEGSRCYF